MHHLIFIHLLNTKTESGYRQIYDAYATRLYGFILPVMDNKHMAEEMIIKTFTGLWDESPVLNLRHPDPFLYLLQKMIQQLPQETEGIRPRLVERVKGLRRGPHLTVVVPHASQHQPSEGEFIPRPSA